MEIANNKTDKAREPEYETGKIKKFRKKYLDILKKYIIASRITEEGIAIHKKGIILESNKKFANLLGYKIKEILGNDIRKNLNSKMIKRLLENANSEVPVILPKIVMIKKDRSVLKCSFKMVSVKLGNKVYHCIVIKDISREEKLHNQLKQNQEKYKIIVENQTDLIDELDPDGNFIFASPSYCKFYNKTEEELIGKNLFDVIINPDERAAVKKSFQECKKPPYFSCSEQTVLADNNKRIIQWINKAVPGNGKAVNSIIGVGRDITEIKLGEEKIKYLSFHDKLTGLYNRAFFEEELARLDTERQLPLSIVMGDVNSLKLINDAFGHEKGDELLKKCAGFINSSIRKDDIVARWGGDEFAIILPRTTNQTAKKLIDRITKKSQGIKKSNIPISISFGVSTKTNISQNIKDKINKAEDNMYKRKLSEKKSLRSSIISSLERTLFEKSHETEEHCNRIAKITTKIGEILKLPLGRIDDLVILSRLHDIGKVAIPDHILLKEGKLCEKEWAIIRKHPEIGYNICEASPQLAHISEYVLYHHERWDGTGYPQGLKETQIPLLSRILAVADAFDVMTHTRSYKKPLSRKEALDEISRCSGTKFDPKIVEIMISIFNV
ncbi:MAG TPA: diguanylate cyclase [Actinobacteria bacterium]|nr:diguanylate cyclase [Actinomycetota bacterium]